MADFRCKPCGAEVKINLDRGWLPPFKTPTCPFCQKPLEPLPELPCE